MNHTKINEEKKTRTYQQHSKGIEYLTGMSVAIGCNSLSDTYMWLGRIVSSLIIAI